MCAVCQQAGQEGSDTLLYSLGVVPPFAECHSNSDKVKIEDQSGLHLNITHHGVYWVADESAAAIQRQYLADEIDMTFPGFSAVSYPDWASLLNRLSRDARQANWRSA
jgi:hypothetical protein